MAARVFAVPTGEAGLPLVTHRIPSIDFDALRAESEPDPVMIRAQQRIADAVPLDPIGFTHGDLWSGNVLWQARRLLASWTGTAPAAPLPALT